MLFDEKQGFNMNELARRLANIIRLGTIKEADYDRALARVEIGDLLTGWLPWMTRRAGNSTDWHPVDVGEQVVVLAPSGDLSQGIILPALYKENASSSSKDVHTTHYADGSTVSFDRSSGTFSADFKGDANINVAGNVSVEASNAIVKAPQITLDGNVGITGNIAGSGSTELAGGGSPVARVGDTVQVDPNTHKGTITGGSDNVTAG